MASYTYGMHPGGQRCAVSEVREGETRDIAYGYDPHWRLQNETIGAPMGQPQGAVTYTYDAVGNREERTSGAGLSSQNFVYNGNDRVQGDQYDNNGNTIQGAVSQPAGALTGQLDSG